MKNAAVISNDVFSDTDGLKPTTRGPVDDHGRTSPAARSGRYRRHRASVRLAAMRDLPDEKLMLRFADGEMLAFEVLYLRHRAPLYRFVLRSMGNAALAEELTQDVWMRLIDSKARYRPTARFQTYLYRIAQNRVIDHFRATRPTDSLSEAGTEDRLADGKQISVERNIDANQACQVLLAAIATLPLEQRTAFLLQTERGMSLEEIAEISGVGRETIKSRLRYATDKLRQALGVDHEPTS
jgi:RNA polymerase sigma-70 factor (ECF subfamily)